VDHRGSKDSIFKAEREVSSFLERDFLGARLLYPRVYTLVPNTGMFSRDVPGVLLFSQSQK
jgi:hypothetical protein